MLIRLVRDYLGQYRKLLMILFGLQVVQAMASLFLPTLNADIIDKGVLKGDTELHLVGRRPDARHHARPGLLLDRAMFCGAKAAMSFGRDLRRDLFHKVTGFSAREVGEFGAPSLITRITNDVQQVQMLVLMACTLLIVAPITIVGGTILAIREDGPLSLILIVAIPRPDPQHRNGLLQDAPAVHVDADAHRPREPDPARADQRHARRAGLRA